jgi:hypothetical protein
MDTGRAISIFLSFRQPITALFFLVHGYTYFNNNPLWYWIKHAQCRKMSTNFTPRRVRNETPAGEI